MNGNEWNLFDVFTRHPDPLQTSVKLIAGAA